MSAAGLEPCPNPECDGEWVEPAFFWTWDEWVHWRCMKCGTCGPKVALNADLTDGDAIAEAKRLWNALTRAPRWTSEPPNVVGFYWVRITNLEGRVTAVYVSWFGDCRMGGTPDPGTEYAPASIPLEAAK